MKRRVGCAVLAMAMGCAGVACAQPAPPIPLPDVSQRANGAAPHRTRLILKDGSYQIVMSYTVKGKVVSYVSAERGDMEALPTDLVDWKATKRWERQHLEAADGEVGEGQAPPIDPELLKEEADRRALNPEVAPDLNLPDLYSALALDTFEGTPELVPLVQTDGDLNRTTGHNVLKLMLNPRAAEHPIVQLKGVEAAVQMHVAQPAIYLRVGDDSVSHGGSALVVDTHGAGSNSADTRDSTTGSAYSGYVIVRADVRTDARVLSSFNIAMLGARPQEDVVETTTELLPGGHWMKVTPKQPLDFGEYALVEIVSDREINTGVWDFGVHPVEPENRDAIKPQPKRPLTLERRGPE